MTTRKTETATRRDWLQCLDLLDADVAAALTAELNSFKGGETCLEIEFTVNSSRLIDSESSPRPHARKRAVELIPFMSFPASAWE